MTAALRLDPLVEPRRWVRELAPAALAGSVDLGALDPAAAIEQRAFDYELLLSAPGIELRFDTRCVRWHVTSTAIMLVFGEPHVDGRRADAEAIDSLLACDLEPWHRLGERFALVRIDLAAGEMLLASDRFGVWPLMWSRDGGTIALSDRVDSVPTSEVPRIDPQALFDYVYFHVIPAPRTVLHGVYRLEPATALRLSETETRAQPIWRPHFEVAGIERDTLCERFRAAVRAAVDQAADGSVGCYLSGGTDSSTVAGMLKHARGNARTFSIGFDTEGYDELEYARITARHFGTDHHEFVVAPDDLVDAVQLVAAHYDQPFGNSSTLPAYYCALMARHHGVDRLLAGDGGDELFGGNVRYARQHTFEAYQRVPAALRRAVIEPLLDNDVAARLPLARKASSYVRQARVPMPARMETYNLLARFGADRVFTDQLLRQSDVSAPSALQERVYARCGGAVLIDRMLEYDWRFTLADNDLPKVIGSAQLAGIEVAFPLLADAVVDLSLGLDGADKVRGATLRPFFKEALAGLLPPQTIAKRKHGFGLPVGPWLVTHKPLRALAYDAVTALADRHIVRSGLVDDLFSRRLEEHSGYYGEMVWVLMILEHWLRAHAPAFALR